MVVWLPKAVAQDRLGLPHRQPGNRFIAVRIGSVLHPQRIRDIPAL